MMENAESKYPEVVIDLAAKYAEYFEERGISNAIELGWDIAILTSKELAGQQPYWGRRHLVDDRDRKIYSELKDGNYAALAKKHKMTERQIYNIVNRVRREDFERTQMKLFG